MKKPTNYLSAIATAAFILTMLGSTNAQDVRYTQSFYATPLKINPAVMGMNSNLKAIANYRTQWSGIDKGYTTGSFTFLYPLYMKEGDQKLDIGINALSDKAGAYSTMDYSLALGYNLKVADAGYISLSLLGGFVQKSLDASNLNFDDQYVLGSYDASNATSANIASDNVSYPDVGFGLMWYFNPSREDAKLNAYAGISGYHLNEPNETMVGGTGVLPRKLSFQGGFKILGENKIDFTPNFVVTTQSGSEEIAAGLYVDYHLNETAKIIFGSWYRKNDGYAALLALEHKSFMIGYSYDINTSEISSQITGLSTHEITLVYKMNMAEKKGVEANKSMF